MATVALVVKSALSNAFRQPDLEAYSQFVGFIALVFGVAGFQMKTRPRVLAMLGISNVFWCVHFLLLGALTGSAINAVSAVRNFVFLRFRHVFPGLTLPVLFAAIYAVAGFMTWQGPLSLLPFIAALSGIVAFWQTEPRAIRGWSLITSPLWLVHNFLQGSYAGVMIELLITGSLVVAVVRQDLLPRMQSRQVSARQQRK